MAVVYWIHLKEHKDLFSEGYIGFSTREPEVRFSEHLEESKSCKRRKNPTHLSNAINKHGKEFLVVDTICIGSDDYCLYLEEALRPTDRVGWNSVKGGGRPPSSLGRKASVETLVKRRAYRATEETRQKLRDRHRLHPMVISSETKEKIRATLLGREIPQEVKDKIAASRLQQKPWEKPNADFNALLIADILHADFVSGLSANRTLSSRYDVTRTVLKTLWGYFASGWIPSKDTLWSEWKSCNKNNPQKPTTQPRQTVEKRTENLHKWRQSKHKEVWAIADEIFLSYKSTGNGDRNLAKTFGLSRDSVTTVYRCFKRGWNPLEDTEFLSWKQQYLQQEKD